MVVASRTGGRGAARSSGTTRKSRRSGATEAPSEEGVSSLIARLAPLNIVAFVAISEKMLETSPTASHSGRIAQGSARVRDRLDIGYRLNTSKYR